MMLNQLKTKVKILLGRELPIPVTKKIPLTALGSSYGGWSLDLRELGPDSTIYSFGIGRDASFDQALIASLGCNVYGFDPTPNSLQYVKESVKEPEFKMHPWALSGAGDGKLELWLPASEADVSATFKPGSTDGRKSFQADCFSLDSIMARLGHSKIDVLKMDIEGAEYDVIESLAKGRLFDSIRQILIEFHHWIPPFTTRHSQHALSLLSEKGFAVAWVSPSHHEVLFVRKYERTCL